MRRRGRGGSRGGSRVRWGVKVCRIRRLGRRVRGVVVEGRGGRGLRKSHDRPLEVRSRYQKILQHSQGFRSVPSLRDNPTAIACTVIPHNPSQSLRRSSGLCTQHSASSFDLFTQILISKHSLLQQGLLSLQIAKLFGFIFLPTFQTPLPTLSAQLHITISPKILRTRTRPQYPASPAKLSFSHFLILPQ